MLDLFYERQNQPTGAAIDKPNLVVNAPGELRSMGRWSRRFVASQSQKVFASVSTKNVTSVAHRHWNTKKGDYSSAPRGGRSRVLTVGRPAHAEETAGWRIRSRRTAIHAVREAIWSPVGPARLRSARKRRISRFGSAGSFISTGGVKPFNILSRVVQGSETLTWVRGSHAVKSGIDIQYVEYKDQISFFDGEEFGRYEFDGFYTGNAFADFLMGVPRSTGYILPAPDVNPFTTYYGFFVQDDWRPIPAVTVNVGIRYDLRPPMLDRTNQLGNFDRDYPAAASSYPMKPARLVPDFVRSRCRTRPSSPQRRRGCRSRFDARTRTT